jgi:hypothetical protein
MADSIDDLFECFEEAPQSANSLKQEESEDIQPSSNSFSDPAVGNISNKREHEDEAAEAVTKKPKTEEEVVDLQDIK